MSAQCPECSARSPLYDFGRECCRVRYVAGLPKAQRIDYYRRVERIEGRGSAESFMERVKEYARG